MFNILHSGDTDANNQLRLKSGELTFDNTKKALRFHDGKILGGYEVLGTRAYTPPPGPETLSDGDLQKGYYGLIPSTEVPWTAESLSTQTGLSAGSIYYSDIAWMKFASNGNILYVPIKPLRVGISWAQIYQAGLVYGVDGPGSQPYPSGSPVNQNVVLAIDGHQYRIRLLTGFDSDSSEWNSLIYRVNNGSWENYSLGGMAMTSDSLGRGNWVQEGSGATRTQRGAGGRVSGYYNDSVTSSSDPYGWRPVLELIP